MLSVSLNKTFPSFLIQVIDSTNLTDAVNITIQVNDTNDAPWCDYDNGTLSLSIWETRATGLVTQLACFDSDVVEEFKQLSYSLTPKSDQQYDRELLFLKLLLQQAVTDCHSCLQATRYTDHINGNAKIVFICPTNSYC